MTSAGRPVPWRRIAGARARMIGCWMRCLQILPHLLPMVEGHVPSQGIDPVTGTGQGVPGTVALAPGRAGGAFGAARLTLGIGEIALGR